MTETCFICACFSIKISDFVNIGRRYQRYIDSVLKEIAKSNTIIKSSSMRYKTVKFLVSLERKCFNDHKHVDRFC